jgi:hypothetical protein
MLLAKGPPSPARSRADSMSSNVGGSRPVRPSCWVPRCATRGPTVEQRFEAMFALSKARRRGCGTARVKSQLSFGCDAKGSWAGALAKPPCPLLFSFGSPGPGPPAAPAVLTLPSTQSRHHIGDSPAPSIRGARGPAPPPPAQKTAKIEPPRHTKSRQAPATSDPALSSRPPRHHCSPAPLDSNSRLLPTSHLALKKWPHQRTRKPHLRRSRAASLRRDRRPPLPPHGSRSPT